MKIFKKILVSIVITMLLFNIFSDDYKRGQDTAYAAFVIDDVALGSAALILLSSAAVAEYLRTNPAAMESVVKGVRAGGVALVSAVSALGEKIRTGAEIATSEIVSTYEMFQQTLKSKILVLSQQSFSSGTLSPTGTLTLDLPSKSDPCFIVVSTAATYIIFKWVFDGRIFRRVYVNGVPDYAYENHLGDSVRLSTLVINSIPTEVYVDSSGERTSYGYQSSVGGLSYRFSIPGHYDSGLPILFDVYNFDPSGLLADRVFDPRLEEEIKSMPDVFPQSISEAYPGSIPYSRDRVGEWTGEAFPHARDWFPDIPNVGNPAIPDVQNPAVPADPPISGEIPNILKNILQKIVAIPLILTQILDWLKKATDVKKFELDFDPLKVDLKNKFPFCIPFDFYNTIKIFSANAKKPELRVNLDTAYFKVDHTLDLGLIAYPLGFFRLTAIWWYVMFLIGKTRDMIKW